MAIGMYASGAATHHSHAATAANAAMVCGAWCCQLMWTRAAAALRRSTTCQKFGEHVKPSKWTVAPAGIDNHMIIAATMMVTMQTIIRSTEAGVIARDRYAHHC
jgi:hypothetical protein